MSILDLPLITEKAEPPESIWAKIRYHLVSNPLGLVGAAIMAVFVFCAMFADFITAYGPTVTDAAHRLLHLRRAHLASGWSWLDVPRLGFWDRIRLGVRLSRWLG